MTIAFNYPIEDCDVHDRAALEAYRALLPIWIDMLTGDPENSVRTQIADLMWYDATWRALNEARRLSADDDKAAVSPLVAGLVDRGYVTGQIIAISRLIEQGSTNPKKQILSLRRLVDELRQHRNLFTREIYVSHDALPYDWETVRAKDPLVPGVTWLPTEGPDAYNVAQGRHEEFDRLSNTLPENRQRNDKIGDEIYDRLDAALSDQVFTDIKNMRHKTIAHSADAGSRSVVDNLRRGMSLDEFAKAQRLLIGVFQAISSNLLYQSWLGSAIPSPQYRLFANLDKAMVSPTGMKKLGEFWSQLCTDRDEWLRSSYDEIMSPKP